MALPGILILCKLSPQTSRYWVPINIGNQMPESYANLRPDSQIYSPDRNTAGETISNSYPILYFPDFYLSNTSALASPIYVAFELLSQSASAAGSIELYTL